MDPEHGPAPQYKTCPDCGGKALDIGEEAADRYTRARRWSKCLSPKCGNVWSEVIRGE